MALSPLLAIASAGRADHLAADADRVHAAAYQIGGDACHTEPRGQALPANPRPYQCARPSAPRDRPADDRPSRPRFRRTGAEVLRNLRLIFQTEGPVVIYPASGTGAWEAALTNTLSPGDKVLMCRTGWFATLWKDMAERLGLDALFIETDWRRGADVPGLDAALAADTAHAIKAVCVVHNETSTGCAVPRR